MRWLGEHARIIASALIAAAFAIRFASSGGPADRLICGIGILASTILIAADVGSRLRQARGRDR